MTWAYDLSLTHGHWEAMKDAVLATKIVVVYHVEWVLGTLQPLELCSVSVCGGLALCTLHTLEGTQVFTRLFE